ncbi:Bug family tripartite tricarboxylate transporter substrate binding protein [Undibacterium sp. Rencai35W]|uniref:Bug family tripartite tricarboxylate transporter substrate binding protein n=1 Tax=Undibacterium sp. Rencai35W TaxID=3413046 RepID=UPI003BEFACF3
MPLSASKFVVSLTGCLFGLLAAQAVAGVPVPAQCIVPAKPGGGMDQTCKLAQKALGAHALQVSYMPGGVGAVAWTSIITQRSAEANTLVAYSGGSLLNLAEGKFGKSTTGNVRWVAGIGTDYGMIAVRSDSPYKNLRELMAAIKDKPSQVSIGAGGTIGSQDWLKMAQIAKQSNVDPKSLRLVAFEGGGESFTALLAGHVQAVSGDASEASLHAVGDKIRVLAVLSDARLPGALANVPTAHEQGYDVTWPIIRGVYMGPQVSDADYKKWVNVFQHAMAQPGFDEDRKLHGLYPFAMTGQDLTNYIDKAVINYRQQAKEFGLVR